MRESSKVLKGVWSETQESAGKRSKGRREVNWVRKKRINLTEEEQHVQRPWGRREPRLFEERFPLCLEDRKKRDKEIQEEDGKMGKDQTMQLTDKHIELVFILRGLRGI